MNSEGMNTEEILTVLEQVKKVKNNSYYRLLNFNSIPSTQFPLVNQYFLTATVLFKNFIIKEKENIILPLHFTCSYPPTSHLQIE